MRVWDVQSSEVLDELIGPDKFVTKLGTYSGTQELVIGFEGGSIWFWSPERDELPVKVDNGNLNIRAFLIQPEKMLAAMDSGDGILRLWSLQRKTGN